jgi:hypothetical protein
MTYSTLDGHIEAGRSRKPSSLCGDLLFTLSPRNNMLTWKYNPYLSYDLWWDVDPSTFTHERRMKCIGLESSPDSGILKQEFLLVVLKGDCYERVALVGPL